MKLHDLPASRTLAALLFTSFAVVATAGGPDRSRSQSQCNPLDRDGPWGLLGR
jgi:hypothetical protein